MDRVRKFLFMFRDGLVAVLPLALTAGLVTLIGGSVALGDLFGNGVYKDLKLNYPVFADLDASGDLYVIDGKSRRIVSISPDGVELWHADGGRRGSGFYEAYSLAAVPGGGVCAYNYVMSPVDSTKEREEIVSYDSSGRYRGALVRVENPKGPGYSDDERIGSLMVQDGYLYYFLKGEGKLDLMKRPLRTDAAGPDPAGHELVFSAPLTLDWVAAVPHLPEGVVLSDRKGSIYLLGRDGSITQPGFATGKPYEKPWILSVDTKGRIYILDNFRQVVLRADSIKASSLTTVFAEKDVMDLGLNRPCFEGMAFAQDGSGAVVDKFNHSVFVIDPKGNPRVVTGARMRTDDLVGYTVGLACGLAFLPLSLFAVIGLLRRLFSSRTSIIIKQVAVFLPLVVLSVSIGSAAIYRRLEASYQKELRTKLSLIASLGSQLVKGDDVDAIGSASDFGGPAHEALGRQVDSVLDSYAQPWTQDMRIVIYKYQDGRLFFVRNSSNYYGVMFPYGGVSPSHYAAARGGRLDTVLYSDEYGSYLGGLAPLRTTDGRIAGVFEVYHNYSSVEELATTFRQRLLLGLILSLLTVIVILVLADLMLFFSLASLERASERLMEGEVGVLVPAKRRDEIGDLGRDFNVMSEKLSANFARLRQVHEANARFVPAEFMSFLGKESIAKVRMGDQVKKPITLFSSDIRSFTAISEKMSPKENFDFINAYFNHMGPMIRKHGGFIDRYIGDAIVAIFPRSPDDAVRAGMDMRKALLEFNRELAEKGRTAINFGVGVHSEDMILGVVGNEARLAVTVVSSGVDLANRLEAATKEHHVAQVLSEPAWQGLSEDLKARFRHLGEILHLGESIAIYGMSDGLPES